MRADVTIIGAGPAGLPGHARQLGHTSHPRPVPGLPHVYGIRSTGHQLPRGPQRAHNGAGRPQLLATSHSVPQVARGEV
ncbi:MAG: hypothetical protein QXL67_01740 [Candidatus Bathyarchaeia archaeon]